MIINHLWESTLFALVAAAATLAFLNNGAHVRYWLWFAASVKFLVPFSLLAALGRNVGPQGVVAMPEFVVVVMDALSAPATFDMAATAPHGIAWTSVLAVTWACGFVAVLGLWGTKWSRIRSTLRAATPLAFDAPIPVKTTTTRLEPGLVGIFRPVLLLPEGMTAQLTGQELRTVIAHELCHLRRRDNLTAAVHMLVQAVFWFHPLLWWIGTQLVAEREHACDEAVVKAGGNPDVYAESIVKVCKLYVQSPLICASGVSGADLKARIKRIMSKRDTDEISAIKAAFIGIAAFALIAGPAAIGWTSAQEHAAVGDSQASAGYAIYRSDPTTIESPQMFYELPEVKVTTKTGDMAATLRLEIDCAKASSGCNAETTAPVHQVEPSLTKALTAELQRMTPEQLGSADGRSRLHDTLMRRFGTVIQPSDLLKDVQFKQWSIKQPNFAPRKALGFYFDLPRKVSGVYFDLPRIRADAHGNAVQFSASLEINCAQIGKCLPEASAIQNVVSSITESIKQEVQTLPREDFSFPTRIKDAVVKGTNAAAPPGLVKSVWVKDLSVIRP